MRRRALWIVLITGVLVTAIVLSLPYARSAAFILDVSGSRSWVRSVLPARTYEVSTRDVQISSRHGMVAARVFEPATRADQSVIVFPGVHSGGVDEPRLSAFSHRLAATGVRVVSVPLPDLREFRITARTTDVIEDAVIWMTSTPALAPSGRVSIAGVSFAGGLAIVAAGRPSLSGKVQSIIALGSHADLPRVMTYLCTGKLPDGTTRPPHDYGVAIILLSAVDRLVPREQVEPLRRTVLTFLVASSDTSSDAARAERGFAEARSQASQLDEPARTYAHWVNERKTAELGRALLPHVDELGGDPALSPERSPVPPVPVFLLHGEADNVIPSSETPRLAAFLEKQGAGPAKWLLTPLISHAHLQEHASTGDMWRLVSFWNEVLAAAR